MAKCRDCGMMARKGDILCRRCARRHHPRRKTYAIVAFYNKKR